MTQATMSARSVTAPRRRRAEDVAGLGRARATLFAAPGLLLIGLFLLFPAIWTVYLGMTNYRLTGFAAANPEFIGLENFSTALNDPRFWNSLWLTLVFVLVSGIIGQTILGFALAWMLRNVRAGVEDLHRDARAGRLGHPRLGRVVPLAGAPGPAYRHPELPPRHRRGGVADRAPDGVHHHLQHLGRDRVLDAAVLLGDQRRAAVAARECAHGRRQHVAAAARRDSAQHQGPPADQHPADHAVDLQHLHALPAHRGRAERPDRHPVGVHLPDRHPRRAAGTRCGDLAHHAPHQPRDRADVHARLARQEHQEER